MSQMTSSNFASLPIHAATKRALSEIFGYETMTKVQEAAVPVSLTGVDVLAKAKTGTGKTIAFLIPTIERAAALRKKGSISALIVSPTRELAQQIAEEAQQLARFHGMTVQCVVGGTNIKGDLSKLRNSPPDILIGTPGRLNDHLENNGLKGALSGLKNLVFDEADQLLEMGFRPAIEAMLRSLPPPSTRQTLLFSATMPEDVQGIARIAMRPDYQVVDTVGKEENTHEHVDQFYLICEQETLLPQLVRLVEAAQADDPEYKVIVFFTTARLVQFYSEVFEKMGIPVLEIHSRKSQGHRNKVSDTFRNGNQLIMFTSDVSARGMDYADVSAVIQVGLPSDTSQYIHRLGRTARAGKSGSGMLLLCDFERGFVHEAQSKKLPLQPAPPALSEGLQQTATKTSSALRRVSPQTMETAYQAWMGFYNSNLKRVRWTKDDLVAQANDWIVRICGLPEPPMLLARTVGKMGLKGVQGLRVERGASGGGGGRGGGGGGRGGGGGGRGGGGRGGGGGGRGRW
jgi:ATP-dependent RNA helicase MSS116